jgi:UDP-hydrolysing UDP-N-acetyl-D-glucosamine 2-epimerase
MRSVAVVTSGRSDYGLLRPVLERLASSERVDLCVFVTGMHLDERYGATVSDVEADGFPITARIPVLGESDEPQDVAAAIARGVAGFAAEFARGRPDVLLVLGDRFEVYAAAVAALPFRIAVAHIHGGESTVGLIDEAIRHSLTKLSHLHFVATEEYAHRVVQLGEEPWRVRVTGAPGLDALAAAQPLAPDELRERFGVELTDDTLLVTYHPVTLEYERTEEQMNELLAALASVDRPVVLTGPNADTSNRTVARLLERFADEQARATLVTSLGTAAYATLLRGAAAMVGNSSSGIIEAATFELPVVNIGTRQQGRLRPGNVIDVGDEREAIVAGIERALSSEFRASLRGLANPYGDGHAAERIVSRLEEVELGPKLLVKRFHDLDL